MVVSEIPVSTTTTEAPKKIGPIIRPFRSNDDLLSALRRRQQNVKSIKKPVKKVITESNENTNEQQQDEEAAPQQSAPSKIDRSNKYYLLFVNTLF